MATAFFEKPGTSAERLDFYRRLDSKNTAPGILPRDVQHGEQLFVDLAEANNPIGSLRIAFELDANRG